MKTAKFYTLGCKVNQYETQTIREEFQKIGFQESEDDKQASVCVINTCTVTHRADRHSLYLIRRAYRENPEARIIVTGCLTQFDADKIASIPGVTLIVKNEDKNRIIHLLDNLTSTREPISKSRIPISESRIPIPDTRFGITYFKNHSRAFLKVQDGCNYHCSYCKVRLVRGESRSRALSEIKKETAALVGNGYREIVLSGICLGSYGNDFIPRLSLAKVIEELEGIQEGFRIRLSSIEVNDITEELIHVMAKSDRVCRHLHIPVQSGDEQILRRMNRSYSPDGYIRLISQIRRRMPDVAITTDVMVGFPGETEKNFKNTVQLIKRIDPSRVHIFPYSKRLNTSAYSFGEFVPESRIKLRIANLEKVAQTLYLAYCRRFIYQVCEVLVERLVEGTPDLWEGYTDNYIKVRVESNLNLKKQIIHAKLKSVYKDFVLADVVC